MRFETGILLSMLSFSAMFFIGCASDSDTTGQRARTKEMAMGPVEDFCRPPLNSVDRAAAPARSAAGRVRNFEVSKDRKISYKTHLAMQCPDVSKAIRSAGEIARKHHGYVSQSDNISIRMKIPVDAADAALAELEALGKVTERQISAQDVTEQYVDTQVRIDNLRKLHGKLTELLNRAKNVDEILKVERELSRVTTSLERYEAMMKNLALRVTMVDMSIRFRPVLQTEAAGPMIPIPWVGKLGTEISKRDFLLNKSSDVPFKVTAPAGFAVLFSNENMLYAVNSEDVVLKLSWESNFRDADAAFYRALIERALFTQNGYRKISSESIVSRGSRFFTVSGERQLGNEPVRYIASFTIFDRGWICKDEAVAVIEVWGRPGAVRKIDLKSLLESVRF